MTVSVSNIITNVNPRECECERDRERDLERERAREAQRTKLAWYGRFIHRVRFGFRRGLRFSQAINSGDFKNACVIYNPWLVRTNVPSETNNREGRNMKTIESLNNGAHFLRVFFLRARACTKNEGRSELRNGLWLQKSSPKNNLCWLPTRLAKS